MSKKRPGFEEERDYYEKLSAEQKIENEAKSMMRTLHERNHPCNQDPCECACVKCVQARKYNQPHTHCRGR